MTGDILLRPPSREAVAQDILAENHLPIHAHSSALRTASERCYTAGIMLLVFLLAALARCDHPMSSSDASRQGQRASLDSLYRQYGRWLTARLRHRHGDAAEDLVQETYLRIGPYQRAGAIRYPKALLLRIAENIAVDRARAAQRAQISAREIARTTVAPLQHDDLVLKELIRSLPQPEREIFVMNRVLGLTYDEIATRMNVSVRSIEWRMSQALLHCAKHFRP